MLSDNIAGKEEMIRELSLLAGILLRFSVLGITNINFHIAYSAELPTLCYAML